MSIGEVTITLGGKEHTLRPTFAALMRLESKVGCGVIPLMQRLAAQQVSVGDVAAILWAGILGSGEKKPPSYEEIGEAVVRQGLLSFMAPAVDFLTGAVRAGPADGGSSSGDEEGTDEDPKA